MTDKLDTELTVEAQAMVCLVEIWQASDHDERTEIVVAAMSASAKKQREADVARLLANSDNPLVRARDASQLAAAPLWTERGK